MVSYTRLFLLTLLAVGTPLFLIFQGTMSFGLQIASATVLLAFLAIYVFSGRKPLPKPPKMPSVTIEDDDEPEELDLPAPVVEMDSVIFIPEAGDGRTFGELESRCEEDSHQIISEVCQ